MRGDEEGEGDEDEDEDEDEESPAVMGERSDDAGVAAAEAFARNHDQEFDHALQVSGNSLALFDATCDLHGLSDRDRVLLEAAALMHDTGYENRPWQHHKGSRDLILGSKLKGFSGPELKMIACVARYHRKAPPDPSHKVYRDLDPAAQSTVTRKAALLRVADGLDRSHVDTAESLRVERHRDRLRLFVKQRHSNPMDIWGGTRKKSLFEEAFGVKLEIEAE